MNDTRNDKIKLNSILLKTTSALIIAIIAIVGWCLISFLDDKITKKIISFVLYFVIIAYSLYEYAKILPLKKWLCFYFSLLTLISFFNPWDQTLDWMTNKNLDINLTLLQYQYSMFGIPGIGYLFQLILVLIPFISLKKFNNKKVFLWYLISYIVVIILSISGKNLVIANVDQPGFILAIFLGAIATDSFSYFGGILLGNKIFKRKLAPKISPNKTIEGALCGFIFTWISLFLMFEFWSFTKIQNVNENNINLIVTIVVPIFLPIVAMIGDLSFSSIKRIAKIKDFSNFIPGHGGALDRIDSIALVCFTFLSILIFV